MRKAPLFLALFFLLSSPAPAVGVDGLVRKASPHGVSETLDRLERILTDKGIAVALRWRHGDSVAGDTQPSGVLAALPDLIPALP